MYVYHAIQKLGGVFDEPINPVEPPIEKPETPVEPPVEKPETPTTPPSTEDLITIKIEDDIMAVVGTNEWQAIAYGNGKYVAVGLDGYVTTSNDGVNWTTPKQIISDNIYHIRYGNGVFVTCGGRKIAYSINGDDWTLISPNVSYGNIKFEEVAYKNGTFVVNFSDKCFTSVDGKTWNDGVSCGLFSINHLTCTDNEFVALYNNRMAVSSNGIEWTVLDTSMPNYSAIAYGNGLLVTSMYGNIYRSTDGGRTCEIITLPKMTDYSYSSSCITFNDGIFIVVYRMRSYADAMKYVTYATISTDAIIWSDLVHVTDENNQELTSMKGMIVMP